MEIYQNALQYPLAYSFRLSTILVVKIRQGKIKDRSSRTPRSQQDLLQALDDHQYILRNELYGLRQDRAHIKTLASELRTLVCISSGTEGLLWRLADDLKVSDAIELQVAASVNRDHPLNRGRSIWQLPFSRPGQGPPGTPPACYRLRDVIKTCEAIYVAQVHDRVFTHELLIKAIAEQMGGAHEDPGLEHALVALKGFLVNNTELYFKVLAFDAELTLQIIERVLDCAEQLQIFRRARRPADHGDITLCVRFSRIEMLAGRVPLFTMKSEISEAAITCSANPQSALFTLMKRGEIIAELYAPDPPGSPRGADAMFTLQYSSRDRRARTITNDQANGDPMTCDMGWLDAKEMLPEPHSGFEDFVILRCIVPYERLLSPKECGELLRVSPDGRELRDENPSNDTFPA
jgi:hypothetical protein